MRMRKVVFYIDDIEYFRKHEFKQENVTEETINKLCYELEKLHPCFKVCYTLFGYGNNINNILLFKFMILSECKAYFEGTNDSPFGVMSIIDDEVYI